MKKIEVPLVGRNVWKKLYIPSVKHGHPPGTPVYTGEKSDEPIHIHVMQYSPDLLEEKEIENIEDAFGYIEAQPTSWINIDGIHKPDIIADIGKRAGLHPLLIEDILHTHQRPKIDDQGSCLYLVVRMLRVHSERQDILSEQISFVLINNTLISFQESPGDVFDDVRERIRKNQGRVRKMGADYLLYSLMDAVVDNYFRVLEQLGERIEAIEAALMEDPYPELLNQIYANKRELLYIRKAVWPLREAIGTLERSESELIQKGTQAYLRDLYDHAIQVIDTIESFRDMLSGVQDLYLSSLGNKTNQVMKVLTIIATIFIPITFVAGIYGMNFNTMPELQWRYGYAAVWAVMLLLVAVMLVYFRRKKWF
ncbi:MAG TPA: magnesium/cobalt transporter CorA [Pontiella sp.]|nr:magnesium/cobalt transporter CorA [Pontiella sp.]